MRMQSGLIGLFILIAGCFHGEAYAQTNEVEWMGNTLHEPSVPRAGQDVFVQTETLPTGAGESGFALFGVNSNWTGTWLEHMAGAESNDLWRGRLGRFSAGDAVEYLVGIVDGIQTNYDDNGGNHFAFLVTNGYATTWIGDIYHWPTNGSLPVGSNLWLNLFASPSQTLVSAAADYSVNGMLWERAALEFWQMSGSNEWWHADVGSFPPSSTIWYAFEAEDGAGTTHVRPTNGLPYSATVEGIAADSDLDGLPDDWEEYWFGGLTHATGGGNPDGDGLTDLSMDNQLEFALGTDPDFSNAVEDVRVLWKPSLPLRGGAAKFSVGVGTQEDLYAESIAMDLDLGAGGTAQIGLTSKENGRFEGVALLATNASQLHVVQLSSPGDTNDNRGIGWVLPIDEFTGGGSGPDADADGMPDAWEMANGLDPFDAADVGDDADGDGTSNGDEWSAGTDPQVYYSRPGCVAAYLMDEAVWTGASNEVADASGHHLHGRALWGATTATDAYGTHGVFDRTNYVTVANSTNLQITGNLTISFWINMADIPINGAMIYKNGAYGEFAVYCTSSRNLSFYHGTPQGYEGFTGLAGSGLAPGRWFHVVVTRNTETREIHSYVNGAPVVSTNYTTNAAATSSPLIMGRYLKGGLDDVVIESRVQSAEEIQSRYDADGDRLPNAWEEINGLDSRDASDALADPDGDGFGTVQEFCEGTDPFDSDSHPGGVRARYLMDQPIWNGTTNEVVDASGLENHGTTANGATTATDAYGTHGVFNGTNSVTVPNSTNLQITGDLTISFWINMTNNPVAGYFLSKRGLRGEYGLYFPSGTSRQISFYHGGLAGYEGGMVVSGSSIISGKWCHVAITRAFTNREIRAYLNGVQVCSTNYSDNLLRNPTATAEPVVVGQGLKGSMDELLIENRTWSSEEVAAVYDPDGDHLPRLWEEANAALQGTSPTNAADAEADPDGDGFGTYQEYFEGTDPFDANSHPGGVRARYLMDETEWTGAANEVLDDSGLGNHGATTNGASTVTDAFGTHGMFDGTNSVTIPNSTNLQVTGDLTLSLWFNMTNSPVAGYFLIKGGSAGEFGLYSDAGREIRFYHGSPQGGEGFAMIPDSIVAKGKWYHLAVTRSFTNREIRAYLNGEPVYSTNYSADLFRQPMASGSPLILGSKLPGLMDEVVVENRAWSSEEVATVYDPDGDHLPRLWEEANAAQGASPTNAADAAADPDGDGFSTFQEYWERTDAFDAGSHPGGVRARYALDEASWGGEPNEVRDDSGFGNHGTTTNGATTVTDADGTHGLFCGTNSVTIANSTNLQITGDLTLSCWFNMASNPAPGYFFSKGGSRGEFGLYSAGSTRTLSFYHGGTEGTEYFPAALGSYVPRDKWCHIVVTRRCADREIRTYLNGTNMYCTNYSADVLRHPWISESPLVLGMGLIGKMDDMVVENRVWSSNEVAAAFAKTPLFISCPSNLTIECDASALPEQTGEATLSGGSGVGYDVAYRDETVGTSISGQIYRTWSGRDSLWNTATCTQVITRLDTADPVLSGVPADATVSCDSIPVSADVAATDNCDSAVVVEFSETNGVVAGVGTIVRRWTAMDAGGNIASATQTITVVDTVAPAIACPADATVCANATDLQHAGTATATDACDGSPEVSYVDEEVAGGAEGVLLAEWNFPGSPDDAVADGGTAANATNQISSVGGTGAVGFSQAGATTRCANATGWNEGDGTKAWQVECVAAGYANLKVSSKQRSSSTGPRDFKLQCSQDGLAWTDVSDVPAAGDNFTAGVLAEQALPAAMDGQARIYLRWVMRSNASVGGGTVAGTGNSRIDDVRITGDEASSGNSILRVWTATDAAGNSVSATQTITVAEALPPTLIGVPADETASCDAIPVPPNVSAASSCDPAVIVEFSETNGVVAGVGTIVRTWTATDVGGNSASATQTITVVDTVAPAIACPADATVCANATDPQYAGTATATDACDGSPDVSYVDEEVAGGAEGVLLAEWNFPGSPDDAVADGGTAANATNQISSVGGTGAVGFSQAGATTRCANATGWNEGDGTKAWQVECVAAGYANLKVSSKQRSSSTGPRDFKFQCSLDGSAWTDVADVPAAGDNFTAGVLAEQALPAAMDGQARIYLRWVMRSNASVGGGTVAGTGNSRIDDVRVTGDEASSSNLILRVWTATDAAGNAASATQTIVVADSMPLAISCPPDVTVGCGESIDPAQTGVATATDPCGASNAVAYSDAIASGSAPGIQEVIARTWTATDLAGRTAACTQTITVVDAVLPAIICPPDVTLPCGDPTDPSHTGIATATDVCSATNTITYSDEFSSAPGPEVYEVILRTWTATDAAGNSSACTQTITMGRLAIVCPPDVTVECGESIDPSNTGTATVSAACNASNVVVAYSDEASSIQGAGAYEQIARTWTATDGYGNLVSAIQTITLVDTTPPVLIGVPSNAFFRCGDPIPLPGTVSVTDCDTNVDLSYEAVTNGTCPAVITRTWTARDSRSNETTAVQLISIYGPVRNLKNSGATFSTLQETINAAQEGDVIGIRQDTYLLTEPVVLKEGVTLQGGYDENWEMTGGPESTVLDGQGSVRCLNAVDLAEPCEIANLTMQNGQADRGGAVLISNSAVHLRDCILAQNHATQGGAIYHEGWKDVELFNCAILNNTADLDAGMSSPLGYGRLMFRNCTFAGNADAGGRSGTLHQREWVGIPASFENCILWNPATNREFDHAPLSVIEMKHSIVRNGHPGLQNLDQDPLFADMVNGEVHLQIGSPAIDAGSDSAVSSGLDWTLGYGTNPNEENGDGGQVDIGYHYSGYTTEP